MLQKYLNRFCISKIPKRFQRSKGKIPFFGTKSSKFIFVLPSKILSL